MLLAVLLMAGACDQDKFFELKRPQETQWVNTTSLDQGLATVYWNMNYSNGFRGTNQMRDFIVSGVSQLLPQTSTGVAWNEMYFRQFDQNVSHNNDLWTFAYASITLCNAAIQLDAEKNGNPFNLKINTTDYTDNYIRQIGEYYFMRAYAYWNLVKIFAPPYERGGANAGTFIPLKTTVPTSKEQIYDEKLGSTQAIYDLIVADLKEAKTRLPKAYNSATMLPTYEVGRATTYAASALLAKVLFLKGDYEAAQTEVGIVIDAAEKESRYALEAPLEVFNKNVPKNIPKETVLEYNSGDPSVGGAAEYMYYGMIISLNFRDADNGGRGADMVKSGWNQFTLSYWAIDKAGWMKDPLNGDYTITDAAKKDLRFQQLYYPLLGYNASGDPLLYETLAVHGAVNKPQVYVDKYFRGAPGDGRYTKFPLIRLADLYLTRAWLRWKAGNAQGAADDLNKIWNRANPGNPNVFKAAGVTHDAILAEYIREMSGEGWTLDFMMSTRMDIPAGDRATTPAIAAPYASWKWKVPVAETNLNPDYQ
jgi:hypothetical protein